MEWIHLGIWRMGRKEGPEKRRKIRSKRRQVAVYAVSSISSISAILNKYFRDMNYPRSRAAAAVWNGKFIVCGGRDGSNPLKSVECFNPESGVWSELNDMPTPCNSHCLAPYGNNLILMGGKDERLHHDSVFEVSHLVGQGSWKELSPMKYFRSQFAVAILDGEIFVIGGFDRAYMDKTEIFAGGSWRDGPALHYPCYAMSSVVIPPELANVLLNFTDDEINS